MIRTLAAVLATSTCIVALATPAAAQTREYNIPVGSLKSALDAYVRQSGRQVVYRADEVRSARSPGVRGQQSAEAALTALLAGSGFATRIDGKLVAIVRASAGNGSGVGGSAKPDETSRTSADSTLSDPDDEILVTGSRIRGAAIASPRIVITADRIREEGQSDLGGVIRSIPQNFSGGQNPGVLLSVAGASPVNRNIGGGSAINLRGLGPGASLTLLNGKRLTYSGFANAIDVSTIPVAAIDRIDIITDGASAIYGSDAVAGVANIVLLRDFEGVTTALRGSTATRGGASGYQFSLTGGAAWQGGGMLVAYDRAEADAIYARQRGYVKGLDDPTPLYPALSHDSIVFSGHQSLGSAVAISLDAIYSRRKSKTLTAFGQFIVDSRTTVDSLAVSPTIDFSLPGRWSARLIGTYGRDENKYDTRTLVAASSAELDRNVGCYCNTTQVAEAGVEGPLFTLPGGDVRLAAGGGYRRNAFRVGSYTSGNVEGGADSSIYAYGEINAPLVSPSMKVAGVYRFSLSAAARYEKYRRLSGTTTPKIGVVYEPTPDFSFKGTWGRSFKAATLDQQYRSGYGLLSFVDSLGGVGYPPGATAIYVEGPNRNLRPERAESWTVSFGIHPEAIAGLNLEVSYFDIDYTDRIVAPISSFFTALGEPAYAPFITVAPTADQIGAALTASGPLFFNDAGSDPYSAAVLVDNSLVNASADHVSGVDVSGSYRFDLAGGDATVRGSASWLRGRRELLSGGSTIQTAGVVFNPPGFRARAGFTWSKGGFGAAVFLNHLDGVFANYFVAQEGKTGSFDTVDLNLRYALPEDRGALSGLELALTIDNVLDAKPPLFDTSIDGLPNYDSTNYSSTGRTVAITVTKKW